MSRSVLAFGVLFFVSFTIAQTKPANPRKPQLPSTEATTSATVLPVKRVEVHSGASSAIGRLLSVESSRRQDAKGNFVDVTEFSVMTDAGEMKNFELNPATSVRIAERDLNDEVGRYLSLIGSSRARDVRRMALTASGSGDRDVFVSYISEVPIQAWRKAVAAGLGNRR